MYHNNKQKFWAGQIELWQESGKNQKAFCLEHDLVYATFCYWQRKILKRDSNYQEQFSVVEIALDQRSNPVLDAQDCQLDVNELELLLGTASLRLSGRISIGNLARVAALCRELDHAQA